ncbi:class I SAM-dependent methyltransferase [Ancylobacter polymorphus]|uniref:Class I SAM-dependent methyltransferase n=1 Tax=Ancylobacter polymorphus TaxID=223390 RepID=A0A9E7A1K5_9HYPH|nr:class I SAM-dependent methyltransferase [Ancylobacter polymorphus]UOK72810.1 class I SAM-dependent methyltransferase [Ancylobacter polymorphus]
MKNIDSKTVSSFGDEWSRFDQDGLDAAEHDFLFDTYFGIFPWESLPDRALGFDMGCGSGRWAILVAPKVGKLTCIDPSPEALAVAQRKLSHLSNVRFVNASVSDQALPPESQDFGYSLGVLHHVPDTASALRDCVRLLKPGAPFLVYLYYRFDNRPRWFVFIWRISDIMRRIISVLPSRIKSLVTDLIAVLVYFPLARLALVGERFGFNIDRWLLSSYRQTSLYTMRTDSRDRFGTPLEQRFTRREITEMMHDAGLLDVRFSESFPFWCAVGRKPPAV